MLGGLGATFILMATPRPRGALGVLAVVIVAVAACRSGQSPSSAPVEIASARTGPVAYVTNMNSGTVTPIATLSNRPGRPIKVGSLPDGIVITPSGKWAYVYNLGANTVTPISMHTNRPGKPIKVGIARGHIAVVPSAKFARPKSTVPPGDPRGREADRAAGELDVPEAHHPKGAPNIQSFARQRPTAYVAARARSSRLRALSTLRCDYAVCLRVLNCHGPELDSAVLGSPASCPGAAGRSTALGARHRSPRPRTTRPG
jgi:hypothetical protein